MITAGELLKEAVERLKASDIDTPRLDAEVILCNLLEVDRIKLHIYPEMKISQEICLKYWKAVEKRLNRMPVQYIVNHQEFMGLDFWVEEGVLIPRGDTEILVEKVLELYNSNSFPETINIVDIGTGSGAISVSLAKFIEKSKVYAIDISSKALEIATKNARNNKVEDRITFLLGSLFDPLEKQKLEGTFNFVVSNPPYIPDSTIETLSREVKDYEPSLALAGGEDGLDFYRAIVEEAPFFLKPKGWLAFEIGYDQGKALEKMMEQAGFSHVQVIKDLAGMDRVAIGRKGNNL
ncbi:peptide chain release factor N(5)-glutamine methyltransferase [Natronincola ferrireducens]|uniref:Release factor glutamine methyltransferase n=1 Tax=Natronincola ferrireducens TaxID=393762 RepID=A0A1G8XBT8_9FIRM|nr:peptide chain release factor N(5)-glutamine methyltransferase [Natronincola ferrireducens]SDJ88042.1 release factor glutamine methyltransferase [Natronincola ferrireducens]